MWPTDVTRVQEMLLGRTIFLLQRNPLPECKKSVCLTVVRRDQFGRLKTTEKMSTAIGLKQPC